MRVFVVEDDEQIVDEMRNRLAQWKFEVIVPVDFREVMDTFRKTEPAIVLLDIQLPAFDGFYWCREIRSISTVPIIFLSSRDHPLDMVMAMQLGGDDYIQKPYNMDVLIAKLQAIARRTYEYHEPQSDTVHWNGTELDMHKGLLTKEGQSVELTKNELYILAILLERRDQIVSRDVIIRKLWDDERFVNDNTLTVNMGRLRQKVTDLGLKEAIVTKKGLGYMAVTLG